MFCPKCGNQINDSAEFCPKCGNPVKTTSSQGTEKKTINVSKKIVIPVVAIIAVILIALIGRTYSISKDPYYYVRKNLPGTWSSSFSVGGYDCECKLHFDDDEHGQALLVNHSNNDIYFEAIYLGRILYRHDHIILENTSNPDNSDHDYELPAIAIYYEYKNDTKDLELTSTFLNDYLNEKTYLSFRPIEKTDYIGSGERVYSLETFFTK